MKEKLTLLETQSSQMTELDLSLLQMLENEGEGTLVSKFGNVPTHMEEGSTVFNSNHIEQESRVLKSDMTVLNSDYHEQGTTMLKSNHMLPKC